MHLLLMQKIWELIHVCLLHFLYILKNNIFESEMRKKLGMDINDIHWHHLVIDNKRLNRPGYERTESRKS